MTDRITWDCLERHDGPDLTVYSFNAENCTDREITEFMKLHGFEEVLTESQEPVVRSLEAANRRLAEHGLELELLDAQTDGSHHLSVRAVSMKGVE
jgi:hypothetical protein